MLQAPKPFENTPYKRLRTLFVCEQSMIRSTVKWLNKTKGILPEQVAKESWGRVNVHHKTARQMHLALCSQEKAAKVRVDGLLQLRDRYVGELIEGLLLAEPESLVEEDYERLQALNERLQSVKESIRLIAEEYSLAIWCDAGESAERGED